jgi:hypothetical protein
MSLNQFVQELQKEIHVTNISSMIDYSRMDAMWEPILDRLIYEYVNLHLRSGSNINMVEHSIATALSGYAVKLEEQVTAAFGYEIFVIYMGRPLTDEVIAEHLCGILHLLSGYVS